MDSIGHEVHSIARVEVTYGTVGEFVANYLSENGRLIDTIGQISINDSVQFLGFTDQAWGSGLPFIFNLLSRVEATGWGIVNYPNQDWVGGFNDAYSMTNVTWGASIDPRPAYLP